MNDLIEMLDEFRDKYVYIQEGMYTTGVRRDNELIYRILNEMMNRIELQNSKAEIVEDKGDGRES